MKYLGVGLSRTGTTSLTEALRILGHSAWHYCPEHFEPFVYGGDQTLDVFEQVDVVTDIPAALLYREFKQRYPSLKVILTVRDEESWLRSLRSHYAFLHERIDTLKSDRKEWLHRFADDLQAMVYGDINRECLEFYRYHNESVVEFFDSDDLLVMDITKGDGWDKLCPFVGVDSPADPFPHQNKMWKFNVPSL